MIERGASDSRSKTSKPLGSETVHGVPLDWSQAPGRVAPKASKMTRSQRRLLGMQNVHGISTGWDAVELSE